MSYEKQDTELEASDKEDNQLTNKQGSESELTPQKTLAVSANDSEKQFFEAVSALQYPRQALHMVTYRAGHLLGHR